MITMNGVGWTISIFLAYVAGSIPFGVMIGKCSGVNIREHGSKNIGASNVARVLGKRLGALCFTLDLLKGAIPVGVVGLLAGTMGMKLDQIDTIDMLLWMAVALAALLGHMYSPWLRFGGGKGVATTFGGMVAMWPLLTVPVLLTFLAWVVTVSLWKMISLASLVAAALFPIMTFVWIILLSEHGSLSNAWPILAITCGVAIIVLWKHRSNMQRIINKQEPRIGTPKQTPSS